MTNAFLKNAEQRGLSFETIRWYGSYCYKFANTYPELPLKPEPLEEFIASYTSGDERRHGCYRCLRAFYGFISHRHDMANPMDAVRPPRRRPKTKAALSIDQLRTLLECQELKPWVKTLIYLLTDTGIRIGEAHGITRDCVLEDSVKVNGKTGERLVPISPITRERLLDLPGQTLFPYGKDWMRHSVKKACNQAGIKASPHIFRHSFATHFDGSDLALKDILGHTSFHMVNRYRHNKDAKAKEEHSKHSPLVKVFGPRNGDNGQKPHSGVRNRTPDITPVANATGQDIHPESIQLTGKTDDISAILRAFPHKDCDHHITTAEFYYHAALYNAGRQLLHAVGHHAREGTIQEAMVQDLFVMASVDCENESPEEIVKAVHSEAKKLWQMVLAFLESFVASEYASALEYKRLGGEITGIEEVEILEPAVYELAIKN